MKYCRTRSHTAETTAIIAGKLKGRSPPPLRLLANQELVDAARDVLDVVSIANDGRLQATPTFSTPRRSSPRASPIVLPASSVMVRAMSPKCSSRRCRNLNR